MSNKNLIKTLLIIFLLADLTFSFFQYYHTPLHGDVANHVLPDENIQKVFDDPLGIQALVKNEKHPNPNRFFFHIFYSEYLKKTPLLLQSITNPISSVYLACAIAKILVQFLFIFLLSSFITGKSNLLNSSFLLCSAIITPLFQAYGYWSRMGINDKSIAYTFAYAVPLVLLLFFIKPFINEIKEGIKFKRVNYLILLPFVLILPLSGPLIPAIIAIFLLLVTTHYWQKSRNYKSSRISYFFKLIPSSHYFLLIPLGLVTLYSLILVFYNSHQEQTVTLAESFLLLPKGISSHIFHALGFPLMMIVISLNVYLIKKNKYEGGNKQITTLNWIAIFSLIYILLLPLGGYRNYRPLVIRYDTIMPVTALLIYFFGSSTYFLVKHLKGKLKTNYTIVLIMCLLTFTIADMKGLHRNKCERQALEKMAAYERNIVPIPKDCCVMDWYNNYDYTKSDGKAELIYFWNITSEKKLFYNEQN